jgi:dihydroflavonol-4-reductase
MRVFVTGGNGFIGSRVVRQLHAEGHTVRCLVRETSKTHRIDAVPFERHIGDVRDVDSLVAGMKDCDGVIHLASISSWDQIRSPIMRTVVIDGTRHVLEAAKRSGGLRTVFVSTCAAVNGTRRPELMNEDTPFTLDPKTFVYAGAKHEAEAICAEFAADGLPVITVNPCEVYGPEDEDLITASYLLDALKDWPVMSLHGGTAVAHVEDIAAGIIKALEHGRGGERYILGGENLHVRDVMERTLRAGGQEGKFILQLPNSLIKAVIKTLATLRLPTPVIPDLVDYGTLFWFVDCSKAETELGYTYRPADETIQDVVDWLIAEGMAPQA